MKSTKGAILGYTPGPVPADLPPAARQYLDAELSRISGALQGLMQVVGSSRTLVLQPTAAVPSSPAMPMIVYTDGTTWDPGSGEGYYYFNSHGVWTPLG